MLRMSTNNCVDLFVFQIVSATSFFRQIFSRGAPPQEYIEKINFIKTTILLVSCVSFCVEIHIIDLKPISDCLYDVSMEFIFSIYS